MSREIIDREHVGRLMHESWSRTKRAQGFHGPWDKCPQTFECCSIVFVEGEKRYMQSKSCGKFHADLIPWNELPEKQKDINRHAFDDVLPYFERLLAQEREKVREMCASVDELVQLADKHNWDMQANCWIKPQYPWMVAEQAIKSIRQLDLTAPSSREEGQPRAEEVKAVSAAIEKKSIGKLAVDKGGEEKVNG
jgi:hypothetical protein